MVQDAVLVVHWVEFPQHILAFEQAGTDLGADFGERDVAPANLDSPAAEPVVRCSPASRGVGKGGGVARPGGWHAHRVPVAGVDLVEHSQAVVYELPRLLERGR